MNREALIQLIDNPSLIAKEHLAELDAVAEGYPWFFGPRQLQLFYHKNYNNIHFDEQLQKWSLLCPGPNQLYHFLNQPSATPPVIGQIPVVSGEPEHIAHPTEEPVLSDAPAKADTGTNTVTISETPVHTTPIQEPEPVIETESIEPEIDNQNFEPEAPEITPPVTDVPAEPATEIPSIVAETAPAITEKVNEAAIADSVPPDMEEIIKDDSSIPPVITPSETKAPEPEEKQTEKEENKTISEVQKQEPLSAQTESWADIMLKRVAEIKKKREAEAQVGKKLPDESSATANEVATPVIPPESPVQEVEPAFAVEDSQPAETVISAVPELTEVPVKEETPLPDFSARISALLPDAGTFADKETATPDSTDKTEPVTEFVKEPENTLVKEELPFDLYVPAYDISSLEKEAEKEESSNSGEKKMDFCGWLDLINKQIEEKKPEKEDHKDIINRFIREKPRIVIRHEDSSVPVTQDTDEAHADAPVCSETLASILIMQKKYNEAEEMYNKLSLLYPEKSVYFAAQIEKIRNNQV